MGEVITVYEKATHDAESLAAMQTEMPPASTATVGLPGRADQSSFWQNFSTGSSFADIPEGASREQIIFWGLAITAVFYFLLKGK